MSIQTLLALAVKYIFNLKDTNKINGYVDLHIIRFKYVFTQYMDYGVNRAAVYY